MSPQRSATRCPKSTVRTLTAKSAVLKNPINVLLFLRRFARIAPKKNLVLLIMWCVRMFLMRIARKFLGKFAKMLLGITVKKACRDVPREECRDVSKKVCKDVVADKCDTVPVEYCRDVARKECENVPIYCYPLRSYPTHCRSHWTLGHPNSLLPTAAAGSHASPGRHHRPHLWLDQGEGGLGQPARGWERALKRGEDVLRHQAKQLLAPGQGGHHCQGAVWRTGLPGCFEDWNLLWKCPCRSDCGGRQLCSYAEGGQGTSWLVQTPQGCRTSHLGFGEREALGVSLEGQREPAVHRTEKEDGQCYGVHQGGEKDARDPEAHRRQAAREGHLQHLDAARAGLDPGFCQGLF